MGKLIDIPSFDGKTFQAWLSEPAGDAPAGGFPALLFLAEAFNLNAWARATADRYAELGYIVIAPDLHWRSVPGVHLPYTPQDRVRALELNAQVDYELALRDVQTGIERLRSRNDVNGKVGVVGYCLGGRLSFLAGAKSTPDAVVGYYSSNLGPLLALTPGIQAPAIFHFGDEDTGIPIEVAHELAVARAPGQDLQIHIYEGAEHGFCRIGEAPYHPQSAELANLRTLQHFERWLRTPAP